MLILLISIVSLAAEPLPRRPEPNSPISDECPGPVDVHRGDVAYCNGTLLPNSLAVDYLNVEDWAESLKYVCEMRGDVASYKLSSCEARLVEAEKPVPLLARPAIVFAAGALIGASSVVAGGWAIAQIAEPLRGR